jgi:hypothetical protein
MVGSAIQAHPQIPPVLTDVLFCQVTLSGLSAERVRQPPHEEICVNLWILYLLLVPSRLMDAGCRLRVEKLSTNNPQPAIDNH